MKLKRTNFYNLHFWQQWLLHAFVVWFALTLFDLLSYLYNIQSWGNYIFNEDGTPYTIQERLLDHLFYKLIWLDVIVIAFFAEANYHFIFKRRGIILFIVCSLACGVMGAFLHVASIYLFVSSNQFPEGLLTELLPIGGIAFYIFIYALLRDHISRLVHAAEARSEKSQAELNTLKAQVNPHFFFNTLNSLYGTALEEHAPRTAESIDQLASIMRYTMNEAQQDFTSVPNEIKFLEDYLHLQQLRLPARENIAVKTEISYDGAPCTIAPMLLIPFIENAFKYGISIDHTCWVHIHLKIENQQLHLHIQNKVLRGHPTTEGHGTGIENTRKRLQLLYPNQHTLTINQEETFIVDLTIDLQKQNI